MGRILEAVSVALLAVPGRYVSSTPLKSPVVRLPTNLSTSSLTAGCWSQRVRRETDGAKVLVFVGALTIPSHTCSLTGLRISNYEACSWQVTSKFPVAQARRRRESFAAADGVYEYVCDTRQVSCLSPRATVAVTTRARRDQPSTTASAACQLPLFPLVARSVFSTSRHRSTLANTTRAAQLQAPHL